MTVSSIVSPQTQLERDISLLKDLRRRTLDLVVDSHYFSAGLAAEFGKVRDEIDRNLSYALLRRELESEQDS